MVKDLEGQAKRSEFELLTGTLIGKKSPQLAGIFKNALNSNM